MSKAQYDIYIGKVLDLTRSLVVKCSMTARAINEELALIGHTVSTENREDWKYYRNLNGEYHSSDQRMEVLSLDTHQTIEFTKQNLLIHLATAREYRKGGLFLRELINRYPEQETLIRGILNPVNISTAIEAADGTILHYNEDLVEENETNLIPQLNNWSVLTYARWAKSDFGLVDDLYPAAYLGMFFQQVPQRIINLRLANCHTRFAHSFHVKSFLASHGKLDRFVDYLTIDQRLWLYRNIRYIERHTGKTNVFEWIVENILTKRGIPLAEWDIRQSTAYMPDELVPSVVFERKDLGSSQNSTGRDERLPAAMVERELDQARSNSDHYWEAVEDINNRMSLSQNGQLKTKVLESSLVDMTDALPFTLADTLLHHWIYLANTDRYNAVISFENPQSGVRMSVNPKEAFAIFIYAYTGARGFRLPFIPEFTANHVRRLIPPSKIELQSMVDSYYVPDEVIDIAKQDVEPIGTYISIEGFVEAVEAIHRKKMEHRNLYVYRTNLWTRAQTESMVGRFYINTNCRFYNTRDYGLWFAERGMNIEQLNETELSILADNILREVTGMNLRKVKSLAEIHRALVELVAQLSSYSIQILQDINTLPIKVGDLPILRTTELEGSGASSTQGEIADIRPLRLDTRGHASYDNLLKEIGVDFTVDTKSYSSYVGEARLDLEILSKSNFYIEAGLPKLRLMSYESRPILQAENLVTHSNAYEQTTADTSLLEAFATLVSPHLEITTSDRRMIRHLWEDYLDPMDGKSLSGLEVTVGNTTPEELMGLDSNVTLQHAHEYAGLESEALAYSSDAYEGLNGEIEVYTETQFEGVESQLNAFQNATLDSVNAVIPPLGQTELDGLDVD